LALDRRIISRRIFRVPTSGALKWGVAGIEAALESWTAFQRSPAVALKFRGAFIDHANARFGIVSVGPLVFSDKSKADGLIVFLETRVFACPVVLLSKDKNRNPKYYGRTDLVRILTNMPHGSIHWDSELTAKVNKEITRLNRG
jgi:hypothetical protein